MRGRAAARSGGAGDGLAESPGIAVAASAGCRGCADAPRRAGSRSARWPAPRCDRPGRPARPWRRRRSRLNMDSPKNTRRAARHRGRRPGGPRARSRSCAPSRAGAGGSRRACISAVIQVPGLRAARRGAGGHDRGEVAVLMQREAARAHGAREAARAMELRAAATPRVDRATTTAPAGRGSTRERCRADRRPCSRSGLRSPPAASRPGGSAQRRLGRRESARADRRGRAR